MSKEELTLKDNRHLMWHLSAARLWTFSPESPNTNDQHKNEQEPELWLPNFRM